MGSASEPASGVSEPGLGGEHCGVAVARFSLVERAGAAESAEQIRWNS